MRVRFLTSLAGKGFVFGSGEVVDLPTPDAKYYIKIGYAEKVEKPPAPKKVKTQEVKAVTRPVKRTTKK